MEDSVDDSLSDFHSAAHFIFGAFVSFGTSPTLAFITNDIIMVHGKEKESRVGKYLSD